LYITKLVIGGFGKVKIQMQNYTTLKSNSEENNLEYLRSKRPKPPVINSPSYSKLLSSRFNKLSVRHFSSPCGGKKSSTLPSDRLNPFFLTGYVDAEGWFYLDVSDKRSKNWVASFRFGIKVHIVDLPLLEKIQAFFGVGSISVEGNMIQYRVSKLKDIINVIIHHFDNYPLQSAKLIDFNLWKECAILVKNKEHRTEKGLEKIIHLKSAMNKGLPENLKIAFLHVPILARPGYTGPITRVNPHWVSGFVDGDGSFTVSIEPKTGYVNLRFTIGLHHRESPLIQTILEFFGGKGRIHWRSNQEAIYYTIGNIIDLDSQILSHFDRYRLEGNKRGQRGTNNIGGQKKNKIFTCSIREYCSIASKDQSANYWSGSPSKISPYFFTGFMDGEGSFGIYITKDCNYKSGYKVQAEFILAVHAKDRAILESMDVCLNYAGKISKQGDKAFRYRVSSKKGLTRLLEHLDKYPLITNKFSDYLLFKKAVEIIQQKKHLENIYEIVNIKASLNLGLSESLKKVFPNVNPVAIPSLPSPVIPDENWLSGFVSGEGCFLVNIYNSPKSITGKGVTLIFSVSQHIRDCLLLKSFEKYLDCGKYSYWSDKVKVGYFAVYKLSDILEKIIPFFDKYPVLGIKALDFADFKEIAELMKNKTHLTKPGLEQIQNIKSGMNRGRSLDKVYFFEPKGSSLKASNQLNLNLNAVKKKGFHTYTRAKGIDLLSGFYLYSFHKIFFYNKYNNYLIWREILLKVKSKAHLTQEGLNQIKEVKANLNKYPGDKLNSLDLAEVAPSDSLDSTSYSSSRLNKNPSGFRNYSTNSTGDAKYKGENEYSKLAGNTNMNSIIFNSYLVGLIESSGTFVIHDVNSKTKWPKLLILFKLKDYFLVDKLISITGIGVLDKQKSSVIWHIKSKEDFLKLIHIINGLMRTAKIEALHRAIYWYNANIKTDINPLPLDLSPIDSNAWFAGFSQNKSVFSISFSGNSKIIFKFKLELNVVKGYTEMESGRLFNYFALFSQISEYLETSFNTRFKNLSYKKFTFTVEAYRPNSKTKVVEYFSKYPLLGIISLDYELWREIFISPAVRWVNNTQAKSLASLKKHKQNLLTTYKVDNNLNFYLPRRNFHTVSNLIFYSKYNCTSYIKSNISLSRTYVSLSEKGLNPFFISGFVDGEGCFLINVRKNSKHKNGWRVEAAFQIPLKG
jgi:hypothetical protein